MNLWDPPRTFCEAAEEDEPDDALTIEEARDVCERLRDELASESAAAGSRGGPLLRMDAHTQAYAAAAAAKAKAAAAATAAAAAVTTSTSAGASTASIPTPAPTPGCGTRPAAGSVGQSPQSAVPATSLGASKPRAGAAAAPGPAVGAADRARRMQRMLRLQRRLQRFQDYDARRRDFKRRLLDFHAERGTPITRTPTLGRREVDLYRLYQEVVACGGCEAVIAHEGTWARIYRGMENYSPTETSASFRLKKIYNKYLRDFELHEFGRAAEEMEAASQLAAEAAAFTRIAIKAKAQGKLPGATAGPSAFASGSFADLGGLTAARPRRGRQRRAPAKRQRGGAPSGGAANSGGGGGSSSSSSSRRAGKGSGRSSATGSGGGGVGARRRAQSESSTTVGAGAGGDRGPRSASMRRGSLDGRWGRRRERPRGQPGGWLEEDVEEDEGLSGDGRRGEHRAEMHGDEDDGELGEEEELDCEDGEGDEEGADAFDEDGARPLSRRRSLNSVGAVQQPLKRRRGLSLGALDTGARRRAVSDPTGCLTSAASGTRWDALMEAVGQELGVSAPAVVGGHHALHAHAQQPQQTAPPQPLHQLFGTFAPAHGGHPAGPAVNGLGFTSAYPASADAHFLRALQEGISWPRPRGRAYTFAAPATSRHHRDQQQPLDAAPDA